MKTTSMLQSKSVVFAIASVAVATSVLYVWRRSGTKGDGVVPTTKNEDDDKGDTSRDWSQEPIELPPHLKRELEKEERRQKKIPMLAMKKPMYDNIVMYDGNGELLCTISLKKARWYVGKEIAQWKEGENKNTAIQLLFEPKSRSNRGDDDKASFNKSIKQNICVACGDDKYHMRHYIVPYSCRSLLPERYKLHLAHDVVILCPDCHLICKQQSHKRLKRIEARTRKDPSTGIPHTIDRALNKVRSCSLALLRSRHKIPIATIQEYEALVRKHFHLTADQLLTPDLLEQGSKVEPKILNPNFIPDAVVIVDSLMEDEDKIDAFVKGWRSHFVEVIQPRFLPTGWSIESPVHSIDN